MTELAGPAFDAVLDAAVLLESALPAVRDGGSFVGVTPAAPVAAERGIAARTVFVESHSDAIAGLLGQRGRWLLIPWQRAPHHRFPEVDPPASSTTTRSRSTHLRRGSCSCAAHARWPR